MSQRSFWKRLHLLEQYDCDKFSRHIFRLEHKDGGTRARLAWDKHKGVYVRLFSFRRSSVFNGSLGAIVIGIPYINYIVYAWNR
jgi:hypothetical protein